MQITVPYTYTINVPKTFYVNKIPVNNQTYDEDLSWIALWFYGTYNQDIDEVTFNIRGNFHHTFGENSHLSLYVTHPNGYNTGMLHLEYVDGYGVLQPLPGSGRNTKKKCKCSDQKTKNYHINVKKKYNKSKKKYLKNKKNKK